MHGETQAIQIPIAGNVHRLDMPEQRRALVPRCPARKGHHIVAFQRADGNELHVLKQIQLRQKRLDALADFSKTFLAPIDQIHFVYRKHNVWNAQQSGNVTVPPRLLNHAIARID